MNLDDRTSRSLRTAAIAALALGLAMFGLVACSSDSDDTATGDTAGQTQDDGAATDTDDADDGAGDDDASGNSDGLAAGWPDVPMPEFDKVTGGSSDDDYWNALLIVDPMMGATGDEMLSDYRTKLGSAGFSTTSEDDPEFLSYDNGSYLIEAYSPSDGMLSVTVSMVED